MRVRIKNNIYFILAFVSCVEKKSFFGKSETVVYVYVKDRDGNPAKFKADEIEKYE